MKNKGFFRKMSLILAFAIAISSFALLFSVGIAAASEVAAIGNVKYTSLPAAFAAAKDGDVISLLDDINVTTSGSSGRIKCYGAGVKITLEGNGHTIKSVADVALAFHHDSSLDTDNGGVMDVTVKNLIVENSAASGSGATIQTNTETRVTLDGCQLYSKGSNTVGSVVVQTNSSFTLRGNSVVKPTSGAAIRLNQAAAQANVYSAEIEADYIIDASNASSICNIFGGTIKAKKSFFTGTAGTTLNITGGSFTGVSSRDAVISASGAGFKVNILGGKFEGGKTIYLNSADSANKVTYPNTNVKSADFSLSTVGKGIRFAENASGLRFVSTISAELCALAEKIKDDNTQVEYGTVIVPRDYIDSIGGEFNADRLAEVGKTFVRIKADKGLTKNEDGSATFVSALVNIKTKNYARDFVAVGYVAVIKNGEKMYSYTSSADYNVKAEAYIALSETSDSANELFKWHTDSYYKANGNGYEKVSGSAYSPYNSAQRKVLENYVNGIINFDESSVGASLTEISSKIAGHTSDIFLPLGRTYERSGGLACDFTCTGVRFNAYCEGDIYVKLNTSAATYFTAYVDGERQDGRIYADGSSKGWICIARGISKGEHEIMLVKQSQFTMATTELLEVKLSGEFKQKPAERELFIEFYGDSILNGSNVYLGGTSATTSDGTRGFGWIAAEELGADCNIIGRGGLGLANPSSGGYSMLDLYDLSGAYGKSGVPKYDFARKPDAIVVELGINDNVQGGGISAEAYEKAIADFIGIMREKYGADVPIVWLDGYHDKNYGSNMRAAIERLGGESAKLYVCNTTKCYLTSSQGGDGWHPDVANAQRLGKEVATYLKTILK